MEKITQIFSSIWPILLWFITVIILEAVSIYLLRSGETTFGFLLGLWGGVFFLAPILGCIYDKEIRGMEK